MTRLRSACSSGHLFTSENTYVSPQGLRYCRPCNRQRVKEYKARHRIAGASKRPRPTAEELWAKSTIEPNGCVIYRGGLNEAGYGVVQAEGRTFRVHRLVYEQLEGEIPDGLVLDHLCRKPACINVMHLEPVTIAENLRRGRLARGGAQ